jgi:hypothetical protein
LELDAATALDELEDISSRHDNWSGAFEQLGLGTSALGAALEKTTALIGTIEARPPVSMAEVDAWCSLSAPPHLLTRLSLHILNGRGGCMARVVFDHRFCFALNVEWQSCQ